MHRLINIIGIISAALGFVTGAFILVIMLFRGVVPPFNWFIINTLIAIVAGTVMSFIQDPEYISPLRGMKRIDPYRMAYWTILFLFGFVLLASQALFLFLPLAALDPELYLPVFGIAVIAMTIGGRYMWLEPDGAVHIPQKTPQ
ncbi:MAG: hypothetical protein AAF125_19705 [Chloroflexota bacterium]